MSRVGKSEEAEDPRASGAGSGDRPVDPPVAAPGVEAARWRQVQELLDRLLETPEAAREALLAERCASDPALEHEVRSLLAHAEAGTGVLDRPAVLRPDGGSPPAPSSDGRIIDQYRLLRHLGSGGMGGVYEAERIDDVYRSRVALKLLHVGLAVPELVQRFEREREILAQLQHPHIARLLDGGTARGPSGDPELPYLVMELVDGQPIDRWCDARRLDVDARLRLFVKVCRAVQAAHRHLVVHRDLKPSNLLVRDDGEPVLLDFGIAKLLSPDAFPRTVVETLAGRGPLTPAYASPEQLRGESVTTATDVYSLGVVLHELLTGDRPRTRGMTELVHLLPSPPTPERPSSVVTAEAVLAARARSSEPRRLRRRLSGDLDTVILRALDPDPQRRYSSAEALADDIERHLEGLPVEARPDHLLYRSGKFLRRHPIAVSMTIGAFAVLLTLVVALATQRQQLIEERDRSTFTSSFLADLFTRPDPLRGAGSEVTARELLAEGARRLDEEAERSPAVRADLLATIGRSYHGLGDQAEAERLLRRSLEIPGGLEGLERATAELRLGEVLLDSGRYDQAEALVRRALATREELLSPPHPDLVDAQALLGRLLVDRGRYDEAEARYLEATEMAQSLELRETRADLLERSASLELKRVQVERAEELLHEALALLVEMHGEGHPRSGRIHGSLGQVALLAGDLERAEEKARTALEIFERTLDPGHPWRVDSMASLAYVLYQRGRFADAEEWLETVVAQAREAHGEDHPTVAWAYLRQAELYERLGRLEEAEERARRGLAMRRALLGDAHRDVAVAHDALGRILLRRRVLDEGEAELRTALESLEKSVGPDHPLTGATLANLAEVLLLRKQYAESEAQYREALEILRARHGDEHQMTATVLYNIAYLRHRQGFLEDAEAAYDEALRARRAALGDEHPDVGVTWMRRARLLNDLERPEEAEASARTALEILEAELGPRDPRRLRAIFEIVRSLDALDREAEAVALLEPIWRDLREAKPDWSATRDIGVQLAEIAEQAGRDDLVREIGGS